MEESKKGRNIHLREGDWEGILTVKVHGRVRILTSKVFCLKSFGMPVGPLVLHIYWCIRGIVCGNHSKKVTPSI